MTQYAGADAVAGGASGGVSKVESTSGDLTVTTTSGTTDLAVAKVPAAAVKAGTGVTVTTVTGQAEVASVATLPDYLGGANFVTLSSAYQTISTVTLAVGRYLLIATCQVQGTTASTPALLRVKITGGTATYTLTGNSLSLIGSTPSFASVTDEQASIVLSGIATVTAAGTILMQAVLISGTAKSTSDSSIVAIKIG